MVKYRSCYSRHPRTNSTMLIAVTQSHHRTSFSTLSTGHVNLARSASVTSKYRYLWFTESISSIHFARIFSMISLVASSMLCIKSQPGTSWSTRYTDDPCHRSDTWALYFPVPSMTFTITLLTSYTYVYIHVSHVYKLTCTLRRTIKLLPLVCCTPTSDIYCRCCLRLYCRQWLAVYSFEFSSARIVAEFIAS
jgi:hypothetical protein